MMVRAYYYTAIIEDQEYSSTGILIDTPPDRLAGLQRLHGRYQDDQGIHRCNRAPEGEG
jgi:hypothetical protein